jgi:DnaK suppressor protein
MQTETSHRPQAGPGGDSPATAGGPRRRPLLEARWRARLQEVTELALAYHDAAAAGQDAGGGEGTPRRQRLLRRTVASRQALADTEEALARLSAGTYGWCEGCAGAIAPQRLAAVPETRYCARCGASAAGPEAGGAVSRSRAG